MDRTKERYFNLRFIKGGQDDIIREMRQGEIACIELIRDRLGMGWILVSMEIE